MKAHGLPIPEMYQQPPDGAASSVKPQIMFKNALTVQKSDSSAADSDMSTQNTSDSNSQPSQGLFSFLSFCLFPHCLSGVMCHDVV